MRSRSYDARHRGPAARRTSGRTSPRLVAGITLPTVAAATLLLTATGAAAPAGQQTDATTGLAANMGGSSNATAQAAGSSAAGSSAAPLNDRDAERASRAAERRSIDAEARAAAAAKAAAAQRAAAAKAAAAKRAAAVKAAAAAKSWRLPIKTYRLTSTFGMRWGRLHAGNDFAAPVGTPLVAMSTGTVTFAGVQGGYGNKVEIRYWDGTVSYFGHMSRLSVKQGQRVNPGQAVGLSGNTGHSTGPHLHLEIHPAGGKPVNPLPWLAARHVKV